MIDRDDYAVRLLDMPEGVGGFIKESPDGFTNIYINARHSREGQRRAYGHELRHAEHDDLHSTEPLEVIEARADGVDPRLKTIPHLLRARDLVPQSLPTMGVRSHARGRKVARPQAVTDEVPHPPALSPHQLRVLATAVSELDRFMLSDCTIYD